MTMHLDISELERASVEWAESCEQMYRGLRPAAYEAGLVGRGASRNRAPVRTHVLENSIECEVTLATGTRVKVRVYAGAPYAKFVLEGTEPHLIEPKHYPGVLAFDVGGARVFTRFVHHPGTKANDFISPSGNEAETALAAKTLAVIDSAFARFR